jgi:hypothetical protein
MGEGVEIKVTIKKYCPLWKEEKMEETPEKKEPEPTVQMLTNPARVMKLQVCIKTVNLKYYVNLIIKLHIYASGVGLALR